MQDVITNPDEIIETIIFTIKKPTLNHGKDWKFRLSCKVKVPFSEKMYDRILSIATVEYKNECYHLELITSIVKRNGYGTLLTNYIFDYFDTIKISIHCCSQESIELYTKKYRHDGKFIYKIL
jgi:hypothetical protein